MKTLTGMEAEVLLRRCLENPEVKLTDMELQALQTAPGVYGGRLMSESKHYRDGMRELTRRSRPGEDVQFVGTMDERREAQISDPDAQFNQFSTKTFVEMHRNPDDKP